MTTETQADPAAGTFVPNWLIRAATEALRKQNAERTARLLAPNPEWDDPEAQLDAHKRFAAHVAASTRTWTSPTGQEFTGTPEYIVGVKTGWDARAPRIVHGDDVDPPARSREHHHPNDTTTQPEGEVW